MTSREGFDAYCLYLAINNHFNTESYDYFKYNGKVPAKIQAFLKRNVNELVSLQKFVRENITKNLLLNDREKRKKLFVEKNLIN